MSFWDYCKECKMCCKEMHITLTKSEKKSLGLTKIKKKQKENCNYFNQTCTAKQKPFECFAYPLLVVNNNLEIDINCPLHKQYLKNLNEPESEACKHLKEIQTLFSKLKKEDITKMSEVNKKEEYETIQIKSSE